ncbi:MAG: thioredoxin family protein [Bacteroidales bacterium]|nr:thioredoxin family protein [Bacteroidales bacterium]
MNRIKRALLSLLVLAGLTANAQMDDPILWSGSPKRIEGNKYEIVINATIDEGWHLYTTKLPEGGPLPTKFTFTEPKGFKLIGEIKELSKSKTEHDEVFNLDLSYFEHEAKFSQIVELTGNDAMASIGVEYQACYADKCIYLEKDITIALKAATDSAETTSIEPKADQSEVVAVEVTPKESSTPNESGNKDSSLWVFFFIAFGAGLLGLLTPCVFPMIPMTVSFFMGKQGNKINSIINAFVFGISIIVLYTSLGFIVSLFNLGADFATTLTSHWITNSIFFTLFIAFAASFFGLFEIVMPGSIANKTDSKADKGGLIGSFFMALTTVIVSLSCVGPIVGALLVEAASGLGAKPIIGMFGFSLAFAIPFTLFAIFPSWLNSLPRSGGWMNSVKVVLGFIVLAFSLKFLTIIDQSYGLNIISRDIFIAIWIVISLLLGFYLLGKLKFELDSEVKHIGVFRLFLAIASFTFAVYLIPGLFGAPLQAISGLLPPQSSQRFDLTKNNNQTIITGSNHSANDNTSLCDEPKYADKLHLPHGLQGYFDYAQALKCAKEKGKPLFIDFVGHTCANCKEMEAKVWSDPRVLERLRRDFIIVALYIDDRTELPENEWTTSTRDGKVKKTLGKKNADFQATRFNMNGQPYYAILDNNERTVGEPRGYNLDVDGFIQFLDNGVAEFKKQ